MDDAILVRNTKLRLQRSKMLTDWVMEAVLSNLDVYTQEGQSNLINTKLSPQMRDDVLQKLQKTTHPGGTNTIEEFDRKKRAVFNLMTTRTKTLDLNFLMSFYPKYSNSAREFNEVLAKASDAAPNVQHLKINIMDLNYSFDTVDFQIPCLGYLKSLKELKILEMVGYSHHNFDFALLCRELPSLLVVIAPDINCKNVIEISEEEMRKSFGHLRLLVCRMLVTARMKIWKVLPELDIAVDIRSSGLTVEDFLEDDQFPKERQYLNYDEKFSLVSLGPDFSNIRHFEFTYHETIWNNLKTLKLPTQLESFNVHHADREGIAGLLLQFGANLRRLSLNKVGLHGVDLKRVSELCPKLRVLQLRSVSLVENSYQQANFRLEELVWDDVDSGVDGSFAAFLSSLLNLRKLEVNCQQFPLDDLKQMEKLIIEKNVLSPLESLHWNFNRHTPQNIFIQFAAVIKTASAMLPKLTILNLTYESRPVKFVKSMERIQFHPWSNGNGLYEAIISDTNLAEILKMYE